MAEPQFLPPITNLFGLNDVGTIADPIFVDIDGDVDAFIGNSNGDTLFFENTGSVNSPVFAAAITNSFGLSNVGKTAGPTFVDIDSDGDLDAFIGSYYGSTVFLKIREQLTIRYSSLPSQTHLA